MGTTFVNTGLWQWQHCFCMQLGKHESWGVGWWIPLACTYENVSEMVHCFLWNPHREDGFFILRFARKNWSSSYL